MVRLGWSALILRGLGCQSSLLRLFVIEHDKKRTLFQTSFVPSCPLLQKWILAGLGYHSSVAELFWLPLKSKCTVLPYCYHPPVGLVSGWFSVACITGKHAASELFVLFFEPMTPVLSSFCFPAPLPNIAIVVYPLLAPRGSCDETEPRSSIFPALRLAERSEPEKCTPLSTTIYCRRSSFGAAAYPPRERSKVGRSVHVTRWLGFRRPLNGLVY